MMRRVSRPLRIAVLADPNSVHTRRWLADLADRGHELHLVVDEPDDVRGDLPSGVRLHRYPRFGRVRLPAISSLQGRGALRRTLRRIVPDILHAHYLTRYGWQARLSGFHPYVVSPWGSDLLVTPRRSLRARLWARATLHGADAITVLSGQMEAEVRRYGVPGDRVERIAFGVDTERYAPAPAAIAPPAVGDRPFVFSPRAIAPNYRPDVVVDAFAALPASLTLVMTTRSADAETLAATRERIERHGLGDRVVLLPEPVDDETMLALFRSAEAVVSVPESDAVSISVLEAMACGRPVVASDLPGTREHLGAAAPELIVPAGDASATADALRAVLEMPPGARDELGGRLRAAVISRADRRRSVDHMDALYRRLAGADR